MHTRAAQSGAVPRAFSRRRAMVLLCVWCCACDARSSNAPTTAPATQGAPPSRDVEKGPVRAVVEIDRNAVVIPETLTFTLTVDAERGVEVKMPELGELLGPFGVQKIEKAEPAEGDVYRRERWTVTLEPFLPGDVAIPPLTIAFRDARPRADGSEADVQDSVDTPELGVRVTQALADVKPPVAIDVPTSLTLLYWALGVIAAMALVALIARRLRRERPEAAPAAPIVPAHVWALAQLDMLAAEGLIERGRIQEWYYRINAIARQYVERRFGLMAGEQTSEEFLRDLQRSSFLSARHKDMLQQFVSACDPVKYARHQPGPEDIRWVNTAARNFVVETARTEPVEAPLDDSPPVARERPATAETSAPGAPGASA
ncbi:MAG: hypothetical protein DCC65_12370 [Planctomycetota bacterium]|nr:MAG: hypothetical protein DCC65_12370 [Planctomycetota bacterium]